MIAGAAGGGAMRDLRFLVQGSAAEPYSVTAVGAGESFRMFCTCPAGRKGGRFCKHAAALLIGDVGALVAPSDSVEDLASRAAGSPLVGAAIARPLTRAEIEQLYADDRSLEDVLAHWGDRIVALGHVVRLVDGEDESRRLEIYAHFKNGKLRKSPSWSLAWHPWASIAVAGVWGDIERVRTGARKCPWSVGGGDGGPWSTLAPALHSLLVALNLR